MIKNSIPEKMTEGLEFDLMKRERAREEGLVQSLWLHPYTLWIGLRYLKSKKHSRFLSFITILSIMGVGLGVSAMIVVLSVMDGFESELKKRMVSSEIHILLEPKESVPGFSDGYVPRDAIPNSVIEGVAREPRNTLIGFWPVISSEAILRAGKKVTGVSLKGVHTDRLAQLQKQVVHSLPTPLPSQGIREEAGSGGVPSNSKEEKEATSPSSAALREEGRSSAADASEELSRGGNYPSLFIGQELSYELSLLPGDYVDLISPLETEGPLEGVPRMKRFRIEGIYHSGLPEQELHSVFTKESSSRSFLRRSQIVSHWELTLRNFDRAPELAQDLRRLLPHFKIKDWKELNERLFASLRLERFSMFIILAFIIIVASFNIVTTLTLMVLEKKREISILKAMGATHNQIGAIFLAEGALIGSLGILGGISSGFLICTSLKRYEFITLPEIYYDRTLPVTFEPNYYAFVSISAFLIVLGACFYPSRRAARINPLDGIRFG